MHHVRQENLPFVGSSHEFVGAEQGDTGVSVFLFHGKSGPGGSPVRDRARTVPSLISRWRGTLAILCDAGLNQMLWAARSR